MTTDTITRHWENIAKVAISSIKELSNINVRVIEQLTEQQMAVLNTCLETSQKELDLAAKTKTPEDMLKLQSALIADYNSKLMKIFENTSNILTNCNFDIGKWVERSVTVPTGTTSKKSRTR